MSLPGAGGILLIPWVLALGEATPRPAPPAPRPGLRPVLPPDPVFMAEDLLPHLRRLALEKDYREFQVLTPVELDPFVGNAWWFHQHAGAIGVALEAGELSDLGVDELVRHGYLAPGMSSLALKDRPGRRKAGAPLDPARLDNLPGEKDARARPGAFTWSQGPLLKATYQAGLYRLLKAIPAPLWDTLRIGKRGTRAENPGDLSLVWQVDATPVLEMTLRRQPTGALALIYLHYLVWPKQLQRLAEGRRPEPKAIDRDPG